MLPSDTDEAVAAFQYMQTDPKIEKNKVGIIGFSYSAAVALAAAADPLIANQVKYVGSFGGFYDGENELKYITTGYFEYQGILYHQKVDDYSRHVFAFNLANYTENKNDTAILTPLLDKIEKDLALDKNEREKISQLSPEGKTVYNLLVNRDQNQFAELYQKLPESIRDTIEILSPKNFIANIKARLLIAHGQKDPQIPQTESQLLYDSIQNKSNAHLALLGTFTHVDVKLPNLTFVSFFNFYLPEFFKLQSFIYDFLWQTR
jgi:dienelactone hydrolase